MMCTSKALSIIHLFIHGMARSFKKTRKTYRGRIRKSRYRRAPARRYRRRKSKIFTKRLGTRYPLGQRATVKLSWTDNGIIIGDGTLSFASTSPYGLNTLASPAKNGSTDNRASKFLPSQFNKYRVRGMSYKIRAALVNTAVPQPGYMYVIPYDYADPPNSTAPADPGHIEQINQAKMKMLDGYNASGKLTYMSGYIDCVKLRGDREAANDSAYDGTVSVLGNWVDPPDLFNYIIGWGTVGNVPALTSQSLAYQIKTTYYVEFFDVAMAGIE